MQCPKCRLVNPELAALCDCGYEFASGRMRTAARPLPAGGEDVRSIARGYKVNAILGQRWGALIVDIFFFLVVLLSVSMATTGEKEWLLPAWGVFIPVYFIVLEGKWGVTLGKLAAKLRVVTADGAVPGYGRAAVRMLARLIEINPILFGGLPAGIAVATSEHRQRFGDMLAGTYVLNALDLGRVAKR